YVGDHAMSNKASTVYRTALGPADRRLFPPRQQHEIIALATRPPQREGHPMTHWSISDLTRAVLQNNITDSICESTIWRLLDQTAIKPHRWHYWLNSPDPEFYPKMHEIVELYLNALNMYERGEILLSVDEKTSIQALGRRYPHKPMIPGRRELIEHEYKRHGTCCLTAGLEVATGEVMGLLTPNRPAEVFAEFLAWVCQTYSEARRIHVVLDNLNTHYHTLTCEVVADLCKRKLGPMPTGRERKAFLADSSKRIVFHFTPSHASWLNQIEIWFSTLARKVLHRGDFSSVDDLQDKIIAFIEYYDMHLAKPYQWTYTGKPLAVQRNAA
ncbi:MAG TPA: IS630 family transposase, partial [Opitutales bacterium]|nr:IS630 family transposase [Opitutales bacterium]